MSTKTLRGCTLGLLGALALGGCGTNFDPPSLVESVRVLAISADKPYAKPGDHVKIEMLAYDGRPDKPEPMRIFWVPIPCENPHGDAYFGCYPEFAARLQPGVDLSPLLAEGPSFSFEMPADIIKKHAASSQSSPYGVVVVYAIACAGHVEYVPLRTDTIPPAPPLGCFDRHGVELGPADSVFAYAQVYSFADRTNENPVIDHLLLDGAKVDPKKGITLDRCADPEGKKCESPMLDTVVPSSSQERDPADIEASGATAKEAIWVDYFLTDGAVKTGAVVLYDATRGKRQKTQVGLQAPATAGDQRLWAVVRDNRGGVSWLEVPMHVK